MHGEDTTIWEDGHCARCGWETATQGEGGVYCDGCSRRVTHWQDLATQGAYDG